MLSLASAASSFSLAPHRAALPSLGAAPLLRGAAVRMADGDKPMKSANESPLEALKTVPWNDLVCHTGLQPQASRAQDRLAESGLAEPRRAEPRQTVPWNDLVCRLQKAPSISQVSRNSLPQL